MMTVSNYTTYDRMPAIPEWFKAERYDYCENFREIKKAKVNAFINAIMRFWER